MYSDATYPFIPFTFTSDQPFDSETTSTFVPFLSFVTTFPFVEADSLTFKVEEGSMETYLIVLSCFDIKKLEET